MMATFTFGLICGVFFIHMLSMQLSRLFSTLFFILLSLSHILAGEISFSESLTDDESTGISQFKVYTHTISGGAETTINGVEFDRLDNSQTHLVSNGKCHL